MVHINPTAILTTKCDSRSGTGIENLSRDHCLAQRFCVSVTVNHSSLW